MVKATLTDRDVEKVRDLFKGAVDCMAHATGMSLAAKLSIKMNPTSTTSVTYAFAEDGAPQGRLDLGDGDGIGQAFDPTELTEREDDSASDVVEYKAFGLDGVDRIIRVNAQTGEVLEDVEKVGDNDGGSCGGAERDLQAEGDSCGSGSGGLRDGSECHESDEASSAHADGQIEDGAGEDAAEVEAPEPAAREVKPDTVEPEPILDDVSTVGDPDALIDLHKGMVLLSRENGDRYRVEFVGAGPDPNTLVEVMDLTDETLLSVPRAAFCHGFFTIEQAEAPAPEPEAEQTQAPDDGDVFTL